VHVLNVRPAIRYGYAILLDQRRRMDQERWLVDRRERVLLGACHL
jgi:hypothetical protein